MNRPSSIVACHRTVYRHSWRTLWRRRAVQVPVDWTNPYGAR